MLDVYFVNKILNRPLAQLVEQLAFNQFVEGSNPSRPTTSIKLFQLILNEETRNGR
jgi:hypothetical protein